MSKPFLGHEDPIQGAISETISAISALNMHPDPIPGATGYLSETDAWAKHTVEHLDTVLTLLGRAHSERERTRFADFQRAEATTKRVERLETVDHRPTDNERAVLARARACIASHKYPYIDNDDNTEIGVDDRAEVARFAKVLVDIATRVFPTSRHVIKGG
jgi:hypothetical protein